MGANGQLGGNFGSFVDAQTGKGYQTIGHFEGMSIVTTSDKRPLSAPIVSQDAVVMGLVRHSAKSQVKYIAFYDKKTKSVKKTIDILYDSEGNIVPSQYKIVKGKRVVIGTHSHRWEEHAGGNTGRVSHDEDNRFLLTKRELRWLQKAERYNQSQAE